MVMISATHFGTFQLHVAVGRDYDVALSCRSLNYMHCVELVLRLFCPVEKCLCPFSIVCAVR